MSDIQILALVHLASVIVAGVTLWNMRKEEIHTVGNLLMAIFILLVPILTTLFALVLIIDTLNNKYEDFLDKPIHWK